MEAGPNRHGSTSSIWHLPEVQHLRQHDGGQLTPAAGRTGRRPRLSAAPPAARHEAGRGESFPSRGPPPILPIA